MLSLTPGAAVGTLKKQCQDRSRSTEDLSLWELLGLATTSLLFTSFISTITLLFELVEILRQNL